MKAEWPALLLGDLCDRITVGHVGKMSDQYVDGGVVFFRSQDVKPFHLDVESARRVSGAFADSLTKSELTAGDVVVVRTGYPGTAAVVPEGIGRANCADLVVITPGPRLDPHVLVTIFNSSFGQRLVNGRLVGVAQQHFNVSAAKALELRLPPIEEQRIIGRVACSFNILIENIRRRIEILEEMAQLLYREWFVHFRFPGNEGVGLVESDLGPIPVGWEVSRVGDAIETIGGGTPSKGVEEFWKEGTVQWFTPTDLTRSGSAFAFESESQITELGLKKSSAKLFPADSVMMTSRATIGVISISATSAATNQGFITCVPSELLPSSYLYFWLHANVDLFLSLAGGATFKELRKSTFRELPILVPDSRVMGSFQQHIGPLMALIRNLLQQVEILERVRDLLLPRLVSGELDVSKLDLGLEAVGA